MNPVAMFFASGDSLYLGAALLLITALSVEYIGWRRFRVLLIPVIFLASTLMVMACPPFPLWADACFASALLFWLVARSWRKSAPNHRTLREPSTFLLAACLVAAPAVEFPHRRMPVIVGPASDHLVVLGDSISSGIDPRVPVWPNLLHQQMGVPVKNLSQAGAGISETTATAQKIGPQDTLVLVEIGGNDLLSDMPSAEFARALDSLLSRLSASGRTVVMFELPLVPNKTAFGLIQRQVARRYSVVLIPKHYFAEVLSGTDATSDGLHLSAVGAQRMASLVERALWRILKPAQPATADKSGMRIYPALRSVARLSTTVP